MKHLGDITKISGHDVPLVDVITGGSPCQDLSIAGKRKGLEGERSGLFMEQIRIIKEMRDESISRLQSGGATFDIRHIQPRYMVWENVPGAFSSNKGEGFRCVLEEVCRVADKTANVPMPEKRKWSTSGCILGDGWSVAWRVHDAQFWGVPQRRKRIALVADFGGQSAPEILFECKSVSGDIEKSREKGEGTSTNIESGIDKAISFQERAGKPGGGKGILIQNERTGALSTLNNQSICYSFDSLSSNSMKSKNPHSGCREVEVSKTLDCFDPNPSKNQGGIAVVQEQTVYCLQGNGIDRADTAGCNGKGWRKNQCYTLNTIDRPAVYSIGHDERSAQFTTDEKTDPLTASDYKDPIKIADCRKTYQEKTGTLDCGITKGTGNQLVSQDMYVANQSVVRRLTPLECERLQGFPDDWTNIGEWTDSKGKKRQCTDGNRYKALGNSIALPYWEWMAERMVKELNVENPTMASLFDGIGGFPLVYSRCGCEPIWASEIEEFPIAVTKIRFPE